MYKDNLNELIFKIEKRDNIACYQRIYKETPDYCWYDWGIYHFHLGKISNCELNRTRDLLYAYVNNDSVYCLRIDNHKKFNDNELLEILHENFAHVIQNKKLVGILPHKTKISNNDIKVARRKGLSLFYTMKDGTVYAPIQGGYSCNGASTRGVMHLNQLLREFKYIETSLHEMTSSNLSQHYKFKNFGEIMNLSLINCSDYFFRF